MKIQGRLILSAHEIEERTATLLRLYRPDFFEYVLATPLIELTIFLAEKHGVIFDFNASLGFADNGERILGATNLKKRVVIVDKALKEDYNKFNFTLAHELGHLALHRKITFIRNESEGNEPTDTVKEVYREKSNFSTESEWLEWQANTYATALLMPELIVRKALRLKQQEKAIRNPGKIFVDDESWNKIIYRDIIVELSNFFKVSFTAIEYRLQKLNLIEYRIQGMRSISDIFESGDWVSPKGIDSSPF